ncbi:MAG: hypothetical protein ACR2Q4_02265 [Geminicoccaceae bacterium]
MAETRPASGHRDPGTASVERDSLGPLLTRRRLLTSTGSIAVVAGLPLACAPVVNKPWADGTFWDDGSGWDDGRIWQV